MEIIEYHLSTWDVPDRLAAVHRGVLTSEKDFPEQDLLDYAELMDFEITHNVRYSIQLELMEAIESIAIHSFVNNVLFQGVRVAPMEETYFVGMPDIDEIIKNSYSYYYFTFGEITYKALHDKYSKFQLLTLLSLFSTLSGERKDIKGSKLNIVGEIIKCIQEDRSFDQRTVLTFNGPIQVHQVLDDNNINLDFLPSADMDYIASNYRIDKELPDYNKFNKVVLNQFIPTFYRNIEWFRRKEESLINTRDSNGIHFTKIESVFFAKGTGSAMYRFYSVPELIEIFRRTHSFFDHITNGFFHNEAIYSLYDMCGYLEGGDELREVIQLIARGKETIKLYGAAKAQVELVKIKDELKHFRYYDVSQDTLYDLYELGALMSDAQTKFEVRFDQRVRDILNTNIFEKLVNDEFSLIYVMDYLQPDGAVLPNMNWSNTVRFHLYIYLDLIRFGLYDTLQYFGNCLMVTANEYHKKFYDEDIVRKIEGRTLNSSMFKSDSNLG